MYMMMIYWSLFVLSLFCIAFSLRSPWKSIATSHFTQGSLHLSSQDVPTAQEFADFKDLPDWLVSSCNKLGYTKPTLVQASSLPVSAVPACPPVCLLSRVIVLSAGVWFALPLRRSSSAESMSSYKHRLEVGRLWPLHCRYCPRSIRVALLSRPWWSPQLENWANKSPPCSSSWLLDPHKR